VEKNRGGRVEGGEGGVGICSNMIVQKNGAKRPQKKDPDEHCEKQQGGRWRSRTSFTGKENRFVIHLKETREARRDRGMVVALAQSFVESTVIQHTGEVLKKKNSNHKKKTGVPEFKGGTCVKNDKQKEEVI